MEPTKMLRQTKPRGRRDGLVVRELPGETLVYDLDRDVAHCLNETASLVWQQCDGNNTPHQIARSVADTLNQPIDDRVIWLALTQLSQHKLLTEQVRSPSDMSINRREVLRVIGISAVALPVVASIMAPTPAQAATCLPNGASCSAPAQCCTGLCTGGFCGPGA